MKNTEFMTISDEETVLLEFSGNISSEKINELLNQAEKLLYEDKTISLKIAKRVYNILVEGLQNLYHHTDEQDPFLVSQYGEKYVNVRVTQKGESTILYFGNFVNKKQKKNTRRTHQQNKKLNLRRTQARI